MPPSRASGIGPTSGPPGIGPTSGPSGIGPTSGPPAAVVHVDLDGASDIYRVHGWSYPWTDDPLFETGLAGYLRKPFSVAELRSTMGRALGPT